MSFCDTASFSRFFTTSSQSPLIPLITCFQAPRASEKRPPWRGPRHKLSVATYTTLLPVHTYNECNFLGRRHRHASAHFFSVSAHLFMSLGQHGLGYPHTCSTFHYCFFSLLLWGYFPATCVASLSPVALNPATHVFLSVFLQRSVRSGCSIRHKVGRFSCR